MFLEGPLLTNWGEKAMAKSNAVKKKRADQAFVDWVYAKLLQHSCLKAALRTIRQESSHQDLFDRETRHDAIRRALARLHPLAIRR